MCLLLLNKDTYLHLDDDYSVSTQLKQWDFFSDLGYVQREVEYINT